MSFHYEWREVLNGGVLKEPDPTGPYYDEMRLRNNYATTEEACEDYKRVYDGRYGPPLCLLTFYSS